VTYRKKKRISLLSALLLGCFESAALAVEVKAPGDERSDFEKSLEYVGPAISEPGYHVWGCSPVIGPKGKTHLFATRWPKSTGFRPGWFTDAEIAHYVADRPEGPFKFQRVVVKGTGNTNDWDYRGAYNSTVQKVGEKYVLLYVSNNGTGKSSTGLQRTGMLISDSLDGPWKKAGKDGMS